MDIKPYFAESYSQLGDYYQPMVPLAKLSSTAVSAIAWWIVPIVGVIGAIIYVIWLAKFKAKFDNETHRSVGKFSSFQNLFRNENNKKTNGK